MGNYKHIRFGKKSFDGVICLNANLPHPDVIDSLVGIPIFAADGAALRLFKIGFMADFIIGDLDSLKESPSIAGIFDSANIHYVGSQDTNDFEKTLDFAIAKGCKDLLVIGFHGGELEHTFNNWSVLKKYSSKANLCVYDEGRYCIPLSHSIVMPVRKNETISLIPQPYAILNTEGLNWNLNNEQLELGVREGARNFAVSEEIMIEIIEGSILFCMDAKIPFAPEYWK